jgi:hypothetical protein
MEIAAVRACTGLPCTDVVRFGSDPLLDAILAGQPSASATANT